MSLFSIRRLDPEDASAFHELRLDGFARHPLEFRFAPEDQASLQHKALLWGMYVRDSARGQGLADAIVSRLLEHARDRGVEIVQISVMADNARARRLYERCGFTTYGVEPCAVKVSDGERFLYLDEALMAIRLGAGKTSTSR